MISVVSWRLTESVGSEGQKLRRYPVDQLDVEKIFEEKIFGPVCDCPALDQMIEFARNTVILAVFPAVNPRHVCVTLKATPLAKA